MNLRTGFGGLPIVVKNLLIINGVFYLITIAFYYKLNIHLEDILGLHYFFSEDFRPYQLITYMFMHATIDPKTKSIIFMHIFFNMFALWMFGNVLESVWGSKRFLIYYVICGMGAAVLHYTVHYFEIQPVLNALNDYLLDPDPEKFKGLFSDGYVQISTQDMALRLQPLIDELSKSELAGNADSSLQASMDFILAYKKEFLNAPVVVGASGSVFGLLLAFGMLFPNTQLMLIFFPVPIKAKYFVIMYGLFELFSGLADRATDNVAHFAHLGGMLFGFIMIKLWGKGRSHFY